MKLLIMSIITIVSAVSFAAELKSDSLRKKVCWQLTEALDDDGLDLEYSDRWAVSYTHLTLPTTPYV